MSGKQKLILGILGLLILCALAALVAVLGYSFLNPLSLGGDAVAQARLSVSFTAPQSGAQVPVGQPVMVHVVANGDDEISRVELWIDGGLHAAQDSALPDGTSPFPLVAVWQPSSAGTYTLMARAFGAGGERVQAAVDVQVVDDAPANDRDEDGVSDEVDRCPDQPGWQSTDGCPDRDGDIVPDGEDGCPDEAGVPEHGGCPVPAEGDQDGDGLSDSEDGCPDEAGPVENGGCPVPGAGSAPGGPGGDDGDSDGDGVLDDADPCPDEPGPAEHDGCPDTDGDGIPDWWDRCPDVPGVGEAVGCPESDVIGDRDGDGVPDDVDLCPDDPGDPVLGGCPPPEEEEGDTVDIDEVDLSIFIEEAQVAVEFQALSFQVSDDYDGVYCYPSLAGSPPERYAFAPAGERQWDIAAELGSRTLVTGMSQPVEVQMTCGADTVHVGTEGGWGTYWTIGSVAESHPSSDWDGHVITVRSSGGNDGRWFEAQYRLCIYSCEDAALPQPLLGLSHGDNHVLVWQWVGDVGRIRTYDVYMDGTRIARLPAESTEDGLTVNRYAPRCGRRHAFTVVAVGEDGRESLPSNEVTWEAEPCPRVVRVTFDSISTFHLGGDERWADGNSVGPIGGSFWAAGSTGEELDFVGVDYPDSIFERIRGYRLQHTHYYPIQSIFDTIWTWQRGSMSSPYRAPDRDYVTVELGPEDDLTFGGFIYDADTGNPADTLFDGRHTIPADEVRPGRHTIWDRNIELTVLVDVIVGPEVGPNPDLTITDVYLHEGQLRIHVFNNASDMAEPMDIAFHWVRPGTAGVVDSHTWPDQQIPSGGSQILQTGEDVGEIDGMLFVLDPDEAIPDENRRNNTFEVP